MEQEGWVASEWALSDTNRRVRYYALTAKGKRQLTLEENDGRQITAAVSKVSKFVSRTAMGLLSRFRNSFRKNDASKDAADELGSTVKRLSSMTEIMDKSLFVERNLGYLSIGFAALATLLAIVGRYGVMSYSVTSRNRELGIRMAIGATPEVVLTMVLRESGYLGIAVALFASLCPHGMPRTLIPYGIAG
jgi:ABC-type antimicrobial peptide transport system permease subunit